MNYYVDLFSPETALKFEQSDQTVSGFRPTQKSYVINKNIKPGDILLCYVTKLQRFIGLLKVSSSYFIDDSPIFTDKDDPFTLRFNVKTLVWLPLSKSVPIHDDAIWKNLSFTKQLNKNSKEWTHKVFASPRLWSKEDGIYLKTLLLDQSKHLKEYPLSETDQKKIANKKVRVSNDKEVMVSIPEENEEITEESKHRESIKIQAKLAGIGESLNFKVWLPLGDRQNVLKLWSPSEGMLINNLPLVFDETTLKTIKNIDVLWIKNRSIIRAFEVEDTTSIYSGILRMADLLSLQPMLDIKIHIVGPTSRRDAVFQQITRPVFALFQEKPLADVCSYISYESVRALSDEKRLSHMNDTIVDEYSEFVEG